MRNSCAYEYSNWYVHGLADALTLGSDPSILQVFTRISDGNVKIYDTLIVDTKSVDFCTHFPVPVSKHRKGHLSLYITISQNWKNKAECGKRLTRGSRQQYKTNTTPKVLIVACNMIIYTMTVTKFILQRYSMQTH